MSRVVLDASALLAMIKDEAGGDRVAQVIAGARISAVNHAEVVSHFVRAGMPIEQVDAMLRPLPLDVVLEQVCSLIAYYNHQNDAKNYSPGMRLVILHNFEREPEIKWNPNPAITEPRSNEIKESVADVMYPQKQVNISLHEGFEHGQMY